MGNTVEGNDGEKILLGGLDVSVRVPVGFSNARDAHKTVLSTTNGESGDGVVVVGGTISLDGPLVTSEN